MDFCLHNNKILKVNNNLLIINGTGPGPEPYPEVGDDTIRFLFEDSAVIPTTELSEIGNWYKVETSENTWDFKLLEDVYSLDHAFRYFTPCDFKIIDCGNLTRIGSAREFFMGNNSLIAVNNLFMTWCSCFTGAFHDCIRLEQATNLKVSYDVSGPCQWNGFFENCSNLNTVTFTDDAWVNNYEYMFKECVYLTHIPENLDYSNTTDFDYFAANCTSVDNALNIYNKVKDVSSIGSHYASFASAGMMSKPEDLNQIPSDWGGNG